MILIPIRCIFIKVAYSKVHKYQVMQLKYIIPNDFTYLWTGYTDIQIEGQPMQNKCDPGAQNQSGVYL